MPGPINRKKNVTGKASEESVKTEGSGLGQGPVGKSDGYEDRRTQQQPSSSQRAVGGAQKPVSQQTPTTGGWPFARPKQTSGQASSNSTSTSGSGIGSTRPSQQRPMGQSGPFANRPQGTSDNTTRPQQNSSTPVSKPQQQRPVGQSGPFMHRPQQSSGTQQNNTSANRPQQSNTSANRPQQSSTSYNTRPQQSAGSNFQQTSSNQNSGTRAGGGMGKIILIILAVVLLGGGGGLSGLFGNLFGGGSDTGTTNLNGTTTQQTATTTQTNTGTSSGLVGSLLGGGSSTTNNAGSGGLLSGLMSGYGSDMLSSLLGGSWYSGQTGFGATAPATATTTTTSSSSGGGANMSSVNRSVASGSRAKYTTIKGNNKDTFTLMIYMSGADLESRSAMGTKDLQEMLSAKFGDSVRVIVYTGGSTNWRNNLVSSKVNQIWQVKNGQMICLQENAGTGAMTNQATLTSFIQYCAKNFKANRYALILWDHGSGSVAGYGYDERNKNSGSMSLAGLDNAFRNGGVKFDFIGFDACLMATLENALMTSKYADYLIASEETEPGIGWYYTDWLTALGSNTSISTLDLGKQICDDFVKHCSSECRGQATTLSVIDLAEVSNTVPSQLTAFSQSITNLISNKEYKTVSNARNGSREFAASSRIDQVDLTDLCNNMGTKESAALAKALRGAVKYNRTSIGDAYGLSVYFPYQRTSNVEKAASTYAAIGMDDSYTKAIRAFAGVEAGGQAVSFGGGSPVSSLFGMTSGDSSGSADMVGQLLSAFLGGGGNSFFSDRTISEEVLQGYLTENYLKVENLVFQRDEESWKLAMAPEQWALVHGVDRNLFYDNGSGYVDFGLDNLFEFDNEGRLVADAEATAIAINGQPVAYYHESDEVISDSEWRITGYVPALLNDERVELIVVFDSANEGGYVAGARAVYVNGETETVAKAADAPAEGDVITFLADLYDYNQNYIDSYKLGEPITLTGALTVSDVELPDASKAMITYRFTDIYNQTYWTPVVGK